METGPDAKSIFYDSDIESHTLYTAGLINQYFLILGSFNKDGLWRINDMYEESAWMHIENVLSIMYFFGSTFICQIVIFNMLIAIMSATFDRHNEDLNQNAKR